MGGADLLNQDAVNLVISPPGFRFQVVRRVLFSQNFHLPRSSLLAAGEVAFCSVASACLDLYAEAIQRRATAFFSLWRCEMWIAQPPCGRRRRLQAASEKALPRSRIYKNQPTEASRRHH